MRNFLLSSALIALAFVCGACASTEQQGPSTTGAPGTAPAGNARPASQSAQANTADGPPISVAHGAPPQTSAPAQTGGRAGTIDTAALDKKVEQAEARAKASSATQADKQAAAAAYLERGNIFYNAGNPSLYKFALRDFRLTLRYDPSNDEARAKQQQIVDIYKSLNRPVPELGNEP